MGDGLATGVNGQLREISECFIKLGAPSNHEIILRVLPEISDSKSAAYNDEPVVGRSFPLKTFSHGENRTISMNCPFITTHRDDITRNLSDLKALESLVYPRDAVGSQNPFLPPPVCKVKCGSLLASRGNVGEPLCCVLRSYSVSFPQDVPWDQETYLPYRYTVNLQFEVVYITSDLPGQEKILQTGGALGGA